MTKFINFVGGPGVGKSTAALRTAYLLKISGVSSEIVPEVAKDLVWEARDTTLSIQPYVTAKQYRNLFRLDGKVDYVVTDGPIIMGIVYGRLHGGAPPSYSTFVHDLHKSMDNITVVLEREFSYQTYGRLQDEEGAKEIDDLILDMLTEYSVPHITMKPSQVGRWVSDLVQMDLENICH